MGREDFNGGDSAEVAPVVAVWRPREGGVVVAKVLSGEESRAVGEYDVILVSETFFGGGWG